SQFDPSDADTTAGFHYAYAVDDAHALDSATYESTAGSLDSASFDHLGFGTHTVYARIIDKDGGYTAYHADVTVNQADLYVTVQDSTKTYGNANPDFGVVYDGFVYNEDASVLGGSLSYSTTADQYSGVGDYTVKASGLTSANYDIHFVDGMLHI